MQRNRTVRPWALIITLLGAWGCADEDDGLKGLQPPEQLLLTSVVCHLNRRIWLSGHSLIAWPMC